MMLRRDLLTASAYYRFRNRWKPDQYIHVEDGRPEAGRIEPGWWSAMWQIR